MDPDLTASLLDLRRHFDITAESLRTDIRVVAEGVTALNEKLDRTGRDIRSEMHGGFAETQAMIKFSHADLDRRVTLLETRVERLESLIEREA